MNTIDNRIGQEDQVLHFNGTKFNKTFDVVDNNGLDFDLDGYDGDFNIFNNQTERSSLYQKDTTDAELTFSGASFSLEDNIDLTLKGRFYFELKATSKTDPEDIIIIWFGYWDNE